jgi:hypothetical protein
MKAIQIRGNCQCCGREHAVVDGRMAKHGYTVESGWFKGVCAGKHFAPIQVSREQTDTLIASVRKQVLEMIAKADLVASGEIKPTTITRHPHSKKAMEFIPFAEATVYEQRDAIRALEWNYRRTAEMGTSFADMMVQVADKYHGKALVEVAKKEAPAFIMPRDQKTDKDMIYTCSSVQGARVYYKVQKGAATFNGWMGSQSWRKMASV